MIEDLAAEQSMPLEKRTFGGSDEALAHFIEELKGMTSSIPTKREKATKFLEMLDGLEGFFDDDYWQSYRRTRD